MNQFAALSLIFHVLNFEIVKAQNIIGSLCSDDKSVTSEEKREIINEGEKRISEFLSKVKQLESEANDEELVNKFQEYKSEIASCDNIYVKCLM